MKSKNIFKILLDAAMTVLFCVLTFLPQTGIVFHEVGGMLLFAMFVAVRYSPLRICTYRRF